MLLAMLVSLPMGLVAARAVAYDLHEFADPCLQWGVGSNGSVTLGSVSVRPNDPCARRISQTSETRTRALITVLIVPGGIIVAIGLGLVGAASSRPTLMLVGACLMFLEAFPLVFSFAPVALLTAGALALLATKVQSEKTRSRLNVLHL